MAYKSSSRQGAPFLWVVLHTAEGARTKESLGSYFYQASTMASSHVGIDAGGILQYVPYADAAWTLRYGNEESDNAEICGFARWTRAQWLSTGTVDGCVNPRQMVRNAAAWAKSRCAARGISRQHLTPAQVGGRSMKGIIDHHDYTLGTGDGTHTDVGDGFPWDVFYADMETSMAISDADADKIALAVLGYKNTNAPGVLNRDVYGLMVAAANTWQQQLEDGNWTPGGDNSAEHAVAYLHQMSARVPQLQSAMETLAASNAELEAKLDQILGMLQP